MMKLLIEHKADINAVDSYRNTPLFIAVSVGLSTLTYTFLNYRSIQNIHVEFITFDLILGKKDIVTLLMKNGADVNIRNKQDRAPCDVAVGKGKM